MITHGFIALYNDEPIIESISFDEDGVKEKIGCLFHSSYDGEGWWIAKQLGYIIRPCTVTIEITAIEGQTSLKGICRECGDGSFALSSGDVCPECADIKHQSLAASCQG